MKKRIGLGTWSWGNKIFWNYKTSNDENLRETFNEAVKSGFDLIDTAILDYQRKRLVKNEYLYLS